MKNLFICLILVAANFAIAGNLNLPVADLLKMEEGTIEFWFKSDRDLAKIKAGGKGYNHINTLFAFKTENAGILSCNMYFNGDKGPLISVSQSFDKGKAMPLGPCQIELKSNEWYHIAYAWNGKKSILFLNGKELHECTQNAEYSVLFGKVVGNLTFGDNYGNYGLSIDEIRLSSVRRNTNELGFNGKLSGDIYTVFLENFDTEFKPDDKTSTTPVVSSNSKGIIPTAESKFVEGKFGKGMDFK